MDFNLITLSGRATKDPEFKSLTNKNGDPNNLLTFNIANNSAHNKDEAIFIKVDYWGRSAVPLSEFIRKGTSLIVTGKLVEDSWIDKDGNKKSKFKIVANEIILIDKKKEELSDVPF